MTSKTTRPIDCPDCDSPIIWIGDHTGVCACSSTYPDDQASADALAFASRRKFGETYGAREYGSGINRKYGDD